MSSFLSWSECSSSFSFSVSCGTKNTTDDLPFVTSSRGSSGLNLTEVWRSTKSRGRVVPVNTGTSLLSRRSQTRTRWGMVGDVPGDVPRDVGDSDSKSSFSVANHRPHGVTSAAAIPHWCSPLMIRRGSPWSMSQMMICESGPASHVITTERSSLARRLRMALRWPRRNICVPGSSF